MPCLHPYGAGVSLRVKACSCAAGAIACIAVGVSNAFSSYAFGGLLITFFVSASVLTRISSKYKKRYDAEHKTDGQRDWKQVLCNGAVPSILSVAFAWLMQLRHAPFLHGCVVVVRPALRTPNDLAGRGGAGG